MLKGDTGTLSSYFARIGLCAERCAGLSDIVPANGPRPTHPHRLLHMGHCRRRSDASFNSMIGGLGLGIQFFNKMELNASYALPVDSPGIEAGFWNVGFDIPIFEYIREARAKKAGK